MTIYLAICDDNIADRKQIERLLEREKDARLRDNYDVLYIDSFGSREALLHTPIKYDMFIIDINDSNGNGMDIAKSLRKKGITAPIVLCSSSVDYTSYVNAPKDLILLNKPLSAGQISHLVDVAGEWTKSKTPLVELRCQKETLFVQHTDIIKAVSKAKFLTEVTLADGTYAQVQESIQSVYRLIAPYGCFCFAGKTLINIMHIKEYSGKYFTLSNEDVIGHYFYQQSSIMATMADYISTLPGK